MTKPKQIEPDIAVVGARGSIKVAWSSDLSGPQACTFERCPNPDDTKDTSAGLKAKATWKETIVFTKTGAQIEKVPVWKGDWIVGADSSKSDIPAETCFVRVFVNVAGSSMRIPAVNEYRIPGFAPTTNSKMKTIMFHEFSKQTKINSGLADWEYDEEPLKRFIRSLTPKQRGLLCTYDEKKLIVFISLRGVRDDHPMLMDNSPKNHANRRQCRSNADFSVFKCTGKGHKVTLECHTEYFCVNTNNGDSLGRDTPHYLAVAYSNMDPNTGDPWKLKLSAQPHESCVYIVVHNAYRSYSVTGTPIDPATKKPKLGPNGKPVIVTTTIAPGDSIMAGNYIHGGINTKGCWPLFRNFNWPEIKRDKLLSIFLNDVRPHASRTLVVEKLKKIGYDVESAWTNPATNTIWSSSFSKFFVWDSNYAYTFFCRYVLGIEFYSRANDRWDAPNLYQPHGHTKDAVNLTMEEKSFDTAHRFASSGFDFYEKESQAIPNTVWTGSLLDVPTATGWDQVFADCYMFNPGRLSLAALTKDPFKPLPAPEPT